MRKHKTLIGLLFIGILLVLGYSTFVEHARGTEYAYHHIYGTLWFSLLWALLTVASILYYVRASARGKLPVHLLHASFVIILIGAAITHFFGEEGQLHIREGQTTDTFMLKPSGQKAVLPFTVTLQSFRIESNPGTQSPADFVSTLLIHADSTERAVVSMNNIYARHGYRFYQTSFDPDHRGTLLTVNHDPWGIATTYFGYALLALSMLTVLCSRRSEFRHLLREFIQQRRHSIAAIVSIAAIASLSPISAQAAERGEAIPTINAQRASEVARQQVIYNDRVAPFSTPAHDFLQKIYGRTSYRGLSPEQVLIGWMMRPEAWKDQKMIRIKDGSLRRALAIEGQYASMSDLFNAQGEYKLNQLQPSHATTMQGNDSRGVSEKALRELDEKVGIIIMAASQQFVQPRPADVAPLSDNRITAEVLYNRLPITKVLFMLCLTMGFLTFFLMLHNRPWRWVNTVSTAVMAVAFLAMLFSYVLRWYVASRIPLGNGYETMQFLALMIMLLALILRREALCFGFLLSGFTLLVAHLGQMNPQITPLMPVLHSPLLSLHVSIIMVAYALLALITINSLYALIAHSTLHTPHSTLLSRLLLYPAVFCLGIGIFLGAVWANISWGKYWSWDPKEVWALITFMIYGVAFHRHSLPFLRRDLWFHLYLVLAFLTVLMTYFGVNYFLGGMHSYA